MWQLSYWKALYELRDAGLISQSKTAYVPCVQGAMVQLIKKAALGQGKDNKIRLTTNGVKCGSRR